MHLSAIQKRIFENLHVIDSQLGNIYLGFIRVLSDKRNLDRIALSAHNVRELLNILTRSARKPNKDENEGTFQKSLMASIDPYGGPPAKLKNQYRKLTDIHDWMVAISHHGKTCTEQEYLEKIKMIEEILTDFFTPYFSLLKEIDKLLKINHPKALDGEKLGSLLIYQTSYNYFLERAGKNWFSILNNLGFFAEPPSARKIDNGIRFQIWAASRYLVRIAKTCPSQVYDVISKCKITSDPLERNFYVIEDFLEIALEVPLKYRQKIANFLLRKKWLIVPYMSSVMEKTFQLIEKLLSRNDFTGIKIVEFLLEVKAPTPANPSSMFDYLFTTTKPQSVFENIHDSFCKELFDKCGSLMIKNFPVVTIRLISKTLSNVLLRYNAKETMSYGWRPAIEDHPQNYDSDDVRCLLVTILRNYLIQIGDKEKNMLRKSLEIISKERHTIFRRIELHVFRLFCQYFKADVSKAIMNSILETDLYHEHYLLTKTKFNTLPKKIQNKYIHKVLTFPNSRTFKKLIGGPRSRNIDYGKEKKRWIANQLEPISKYLSKKRFETYKQISNELGTSPFVGFLEYHEFRSNFTFEKNTELNDSMTPPQVINYLKSFVKQKSYGEGQDELTSQRFTDLVKANPLEYSKIANLILNISKSYCYYFINGLILGIQEGKPVCWKELLSVLESLHHDEDNASIRAIEFRFGSNPISNILVAGLTHSTNSPNKIFRKRIWKLISSLILKSKGLSPGDIESWTNKKEYHHLSINSSRGTALEALIAYSVWIYNLDTAKNRYLRPEVKTLSRKLLETNETIETVVVFCEHLSQMHYLDKNWANNNIRPLLLPQGNMVLYYAAWDGYLHGLFYRDLYDDLRLAYSIRTTHLRTDDVDYRDSETNKQFALQITKAYLFGYPGADKIFNNLLTNASSKIIEHCLDQVRRALRSNKENRIKGLNLKSVKKMWENAKLKKYLQLIEWFPYSPFGRKYSLERLESLLKNNIEVGRNYMTMHDIINELRIYAQEYPINTLRCLQYLIIASKNEGLLYVMKDEVIDIFNELSSNTNIDVILKINEILNYLGKLGMNEFRDLHRFN